MAAPRTFPLLLAFACAVACKNEQPTARAKAELPPVSATPAAIAQDSESRVGTEDDGSDDPEAAGDRPATTSASPEQEDETKAQEQEEPEPEPPPPEPRKVLILGDSLAATGFGALLQKQLGKHPQIKCYRKGKSASGLARPDFFDWIAESKRQVELRAPDLVVVIIGGNDGQDLTPKRGRRGRVRWKTDGWEAAYRKRVDEFLAQISSQDRKVLWLSLPLMRMRSLERKLELIRGVHKEAVEAKGGVYLDTSPMLTDDDGVVLTHAKVRGRRNQRIRADDGVHFTMSGSEYFADRVYPEVLAVLELPPAQTDQKAN